MEYSASRLVLGSVGAEENVLLFVRDIEGGKRRPISVLRSADGVRFSDSGRAWVFAKLLGSLRMRPDISDEMRVSRLGDDTFFLVYKKRAADGTFRVSSAVSYDAIEWDPISDISAVRELGVAVSLSPKGALSPAALFFGDRTVKLALSANLRDWNVRKSPLLRPREGFFDDGPISPVLALLAGNGIILFYVSTHSDGCRVLGSALVSCENPKTVLWRSDEPLWTAPEEWWGRDVRFSGAASRPGKILLYWQVNGKLLVETVTQFWKVSRGASVTVLSEEGKLERFHGNPILGPRPEHPWEAGEVFNPAAFLDDDGQVHILYRAVGMNGLSTVGYAKSRDGFSIDLRLDSPIYVSSPTLDDVRVTRIQEKCTTPYASGGGWGGSEDPKITRIDDTLYMTYTAFDGYNFPRVALTKISVDDFLSRKWNWSRPVMISPPGEIHKNWTLFPEKIRGKFAVLHSISPEIQIEYLDTLDFDGETFIKSDHSKKPIHGRWELLVRGVGPSPIKTKEGWLVLYHATTRDCGYKLGAMLLDIKDPTRILARSKAPLLEPALWYENEGTKPRIVYSCGAVVKDETLFVYYGGADSVTCVATVPLGRLLDALLHSNAAIPTRYVKLGDR